MEPKNTARKQQKEDTLKSSYELFDGRQRFLDPFESRIFQLNKIEGTGFSDFDHSNLKILIPKQMFQRLPILIEKLKASNTTENLLNEFRHIIYSLHQVKEIAKKVCNNILNSIKV